MKTSYSTHPSFAPNAVPPVAEVCQPLVVRDGNKKNTLNDDQLAAIMPLTGKCVVNSGAGTGKTTVLVARVLAIKEQCPQAHVLLLTFSRKAALELRDRIGSTAGCQVSTFHSIAFHILKANGFHNFTVNTSEAARDGAIAKLIGKRTDTTVEKVVHAMNRLTGIDKPTECIREKFFSQLMKNGMLTFDSLQPFALRLLQKHTNVLHGIQGLWDYLLVDEAQDCDEVQKALIGLLVKTQNVCLVGDSRQSIYGFRGAMASSMDDFVHEGGPDVAQRSFTVNYRSTPAILGLANRIMQQYQPLTAAYQTGKGELPRYLAARDEADEAAHVIAEITKLHKAGTRYDQMAILYRSSSAASTLTEALLDKQIPFTCKSALSLKACSAPYSDVVRLLRYALSPNDAKVFRAVMHALYIRQAMLKDVQKLAKTNECSLIHAACQLPLPFFQTDYIAHMDVAIAQVPELPPSKAIELLLQAGYSKSLGDDKTASIRAWASELEEYPTIPALLTHIDNMHDRLLAIRDKALHAGSDAVQVMTIHASKGLEFDTVFLIGAADGVLPSARDDADLEEERRLLYVAVTRAKRKLYISYPMRSINSTDTNKASRFLLDAFSRT